MKNTLKMANARNTSKMKKAIEKQQYELDTLEQLTVNVAHEIRNPLGAISHACELLEEDTSIKTTSKRMVEIILNNVQRINQIVDDILNAHHHDTSKIVHIQLNSFLKDFHEYFCEVEKIPAHCFELNLPKEAVTIQFNPLHLDQILWNLCRNGWRHCNKIVSSLSLSAQVDDNNRIAISIKNNGEIIRPETQHHIFEPFFTTDSKGTGLGLYIARQLCLKNDAGLDFSSSLQSTTFSILTKKW